jgi:hypothetical protein
MKNEIENGVENFTCLVGVLLSDVDGPLKLDPSLFVRNHRSDFDERAVDRGNLTVFPGSHVILEDCIASAGGAEKLFSIYTFDSRVFF